MHNPHDSRSDASRHSATVRAPAINLPDEAATLAFGTHLAQAVTAGMVIYLRGNLGAGKTTLVRALLHALGHHGRVKSPTYTLLEQYHAGGLNLRHFDLYRFQDINEWDSAGFSDEFDGNNICLVEWPEQAAGLVPPADLEIFLDIQPEGRSIRLQANTASGHACVAQLQKPSS